MDERWSIRTVVICITTCALIALVCGFATTHLYGLYRGDPPVLSEFALTYRMPSGDLHAVLETAIGHEGRPHIQKSIDVVSYRDGTRFLNMFAYVAPTYGWYVHPSAKNRTRIVLTMPATDLHVIDSMVENPINWIKQGISANRPIVEPLRTDNLINVAVQMKDSTIVNGLAFLGMCFVALVGLVALALGIAVTITEVEDFIKQRRAIHKSTS